MTHNASSETLLQAVHECAVLAASFAMKHYRSRLAVERKSDGSPVTLADRGAELAARDWIRARFPNDGIVGEEFGELIGGGRRRWILDPIDGTNAFVRGVPLWGSLVAVVDGDEVLAGAASFPALAENISAARGCGCWYNETRGHVSAVNALSDATALITDDRAFTDHASLERWRALARATRVTRTWGDAFGYLLVATGRAEVMVDPIVNAWDIACFLPIIEEAGGVFTDLAGAATPFSGHSVATNSALSADVRTILCLT